MSSMDSMFSVCVSITWTMFVEQLPSVLRCWIQKCCPICRLGVPDAIVTCCWSSSPGLAKSKSMSMSTRMMMMMMMLMMMMIDDDDDDVDDVDDD